MSNKITKIQLDSVDYDLQDADLTEAVGDLSTLATQDKSSIVNAINEIKDEGGSGGGGGSSSGGDARVRPTIYCWGDSLTEGVNAYTMQPDNTNAYMAYSYPAWLSQSWNVVNLGARGEDVHAILARQGADPIALASSFTIPASNSESVTVQMVSHLFSSGGIGFTSKAGAMVKINKEVESAGLNPCVIKGVEGILYREMTSTLNDDDTYTYKFRRLESGTATFVPVGTEVETFAMRYYRNGVAIIWMGANGGWNNVSDLIDKINSMIEYGNYTNYLIIISRELNSSQIDQFKSAFTDTSGLCHVIYLMDQLPYRGYSLAGISTQSIDTSGWITTDPIKKNAPLLCDYISSGETTEAKYGDLHFSAWGYKAIAKIINEKLMSMDLYSEDGSGDDTPTEDDYGTYLYKLPSARSLNGSTYLNTRVSLYDDVTKNWTLAIKWSGTVYSPDGYPSNVFCCTKDGSWKGVLYRYYTAQGANLLFGSGVFNVDGNNNAIDNWEGTNVVIISKNGSSYIAYCNSSNMVYGSALVYTLSPSDAFDLPLIVGGRYNQEGTDVNYKTALELEDLRIYDDALTEQQCAALYTELVGG